MFDRHRAPAGFFTATLPAAALLISAPAAAQEAHGVIAFGTETDQDNGVAYGFAWNFPTKDTAQAEAVNGCISSGGTNCVQLAWFQDGCGALAMDQHGNAQGKPGMTLEQAEARALRACEAAGGAGCDIVGSLCAAPGGEPRTWSGSESVLPLPDAETTAAGPADESLTREERVRLQQALTALGFDAGSADGAFGSRTRAAIWDWQEANGHEATGYVTREQAASLVALDVSTDEEQEPPQEAADHPSGDVLIFRPATGPRCIEEEFPVEGNCWHEIANKPGCFLLTGSYRFFHTLMEDASGAVYSETVLGPHTFTWSGGCLGDTAHGRGTLDLMIHSPFDGRLSYSYRDTGEMARGNRQGLWVDRWTYDPIDDRRVPEGICVDEGQYVDGKKSGKWVSRCFDGSGSEGSYMDGEEHGRWVDRREDGSSSEGSYVNGKKHGRWVERFQDGTIEEETYVNGKPSWWKD